MAVGEDSTQNESGVLGGFTNTIDVSVLFGLDGSDNPSGNFHIAIEHCH